MDAIIRVTCPNCGNKELVPEDLYLAVFEALEPERSWCQYKFICPECKSPQEQSGSAEVARWLIKVGVAYVVETLPEEAREGHKGDPFTEQDVTKFLEDLETFDGDMEQQ